MKGLGGLMKQAQKMQEDMKQAQEQLAAIEVTGESGAGLVSVVMTGKHEVKKIQIDDSLLDDDKDMLEDLVAAAVNNAVHKIAATSKDAYSDLTTGLNLPPGMKLPF